MIWIALATLFAYAVYLHIRQEGLLKAWHLILDHMQSTASLHDMEREKRVVLDEAAEETRATLDLFFPAFPCKEVLHHARRSAAAHEAAIRDREWVSPNHLMYAHYLFEGEVADALVSEMLMQNLQVAAGKKTIDKARENLRNYQVRVEATAHTGERELVRSLYKLDNHEEPEAVL